MSTATFLALPTVLAERRAARAQRRRLAVELAAYRTPAERLELDGVLSRHSDAETAEVDALLGHRTPQPFRLSA